MSKKLVYKNKDIGGVMTVDFPVGCIVPFASNGNLPSGFLLCDGSAVSREMFPDLFVVIGTTWGEGDGETTFNLPLIEDRVLQGASGTNPVGTYKEAGLPNITGKLTLGNYYDGSNWSLNSISSTGSFVPSDYTSNLASYFTATPQSNNSAYASTSFDASQSNAIYGASNTVQPSAACMKFIIKAFDSQTRDSALIDITQYAQALNGKPSKSLNDLTQEGEDHFLTNDFVYVYPNNGTEQNPANITVNTSYLVDNPFPGYHIYCVVELLYNTVWGVPGWLSGYSGSGWVTFGAKAHHVFDSGYDSVIVVTGISAVLANGRNLTGGSLVAGSNQTSAPCRIKVWKIGKIQTQS